MNHLEIKLNLEFGTCSIAFCRFSSMSESILQFFEKPGISLCCGSAITPPHPTPPHPTPPHTEDEDLLPALTCSGSGRTTDAGFPPGLCGPAADWPFHQWTSRTLEESEEETRPSNHSEKRRGTQSRSPFMGLKLCGCVCMRVCARATLTDLQGMDLKTDGLGTRASRR